MALSTADEIVSDFRQFWSESSAIADLSVAGLVRLLEHLNEQSQVPDNPDPALIVGVGDPNLPGAVPYNRIRRSDLARMTARGGLASQVLARQFIVTAYAKWDEDTRPALGRALGFGDHRDIKHAFFGDLRRFRHDIVHSRAVASAGYSAQAELMMWFTDGDPLVFTPHHLAKLHRKVPWSFLETLTPPG